MDKISYLLPKILNFSKTRINLLNKQTLKYSSSLPEFRIIKHGVEDTKSMRIYYESQNGPISPFHDIPLYKNKDNTVLNMIVEIPRYTHAKMEINKKEYLNPVSQDSKNDKLRYINNVFPYYGYIWNYGAFPQTYDDPNHIDETTGCIGDNDPIDVCEIGTLKQERGSVIQVKVLGALGLIDEGEADWKILTINIQDPLASELNDLKDVESKLPGLLDATRDWFRIYKIPTGKPANTFALDGKFFDKKFSLDIIKKSNQAWSKLVSETENKKNISVVNTSLANKNSVSVDKAKLVLNDRFNELSQLKSSVEIDLTELEKVHYIKRSL